MAEEPQPGLSAAGAATGVSLKLRTLNATGLNMKLTNVSVTMLMLTLTMLCGPARAQTVVARTDVCREVEVFRLT